MFSFSDPAGLYPASLRGMSAPTLTASTNNTKWLVRGSLMMPLSDTGVRLTPHKCVSSPTVFGKSLYRIVIISLKCLVEHVGLDVGRCATANHSP